jgi:hypothetical protein
MSASRRDFLKVSAAVGATLAVEGIPALAHPGLTNGNTPSSAAAEKAVEFTRGLGVFPGAPSEFFGPDLIAAEPTYRNLALRRPAYHSSSYDYNLTAQLVTDGIKETRLPEWVVVRAGGMEPLGKLDRETLLDHDGVHRVALRGAHPSATFELRGGESVPVIDRVQLNLQVPFNLSLDAMRFKVLVSADGRAWEEVGATAGATPASTQGLPPDFIRSGTFLAPWIEFKSAQQSRFYRVELGLAQDADHPVGAEWTSWQLTQVAFFKGQDRIQLGGPYSFTSAWMGAGMAEEWVYVDLGPSCEFDTVKLHWIARAAEGKVQVSDDADHWRDLADIGREPGALEEIRLKQAEHGRYLRVLMTRPATENGYILSEMEVFGKGGLVAKPKAMAEASADGVLQLAGGSWRVERASEVDAAGEALSKSGFKDDLWLVATVPGTVLTSFLNGGAIADPNYGDNQLYISDSYFCGDFWYRTEFTTLPVNAKQRAWLDFGGVNWKADIYLNGEKLGRIEGGFVRGRFDVTAKLVAGGPNALAVKIEKNATPGSTKQKTLDFVGTNGGALGADNPTYHASIGWDWIPPVRGRNIGIWAPVKLEVTGTVTLENPYVWSTLALPDITNADVNLEVDLVNHRATPFKGLLEATFGEIRVLQSITLGPSERKVVKLNPQTHAALRLSNPKLWWPVGYGEPHLYDAAFTLTAGGKPVDHTALKSGVRQMTWSEEDGKLRLFVNGRRFVARGGNWGFGESMLRYRAREYNAAVRYHKEMNFTMIRNWVGQIGDDEFWEACDRHGVMVWQDFWLANPWDGPDPDNNEMFLSNVQDYVLRIRNHPSIGLYCGRNEGFPPKPLEEGIRKILGDLHAGLHYIPSSADDAVSGHGPYMTMPNTFYFRAADTKLHSEIGAPNIPPIESVRLMMPEKDLWPQSLSWGLHDFCLEGAQGGAGFRAMIDSGLGGATNVEEWVRLAQILNYDTYRAMFEAQSIHRMGVLLWMSHSCWPSFVWQTYDYYFEPTAAYFGCKKGSEPLHIQWNCLADTVEVVNYSAGNQPGLTAMMELLNLDGTRIDGKNSSVDSKEDSTVTCFKMSYPASASTVHFIRLRLKRGDDVLSSNFYMRGIEEGNLRAIRELPKPHIDSSTKVARSHDGWRLTTELRNAGSSPALMVRLKAVGERSGERILPAIYSDNYIALMPGERQTISTDVAEADTRGEKPAIVVGG